MIGQIKYNGDGSTRIFPVSFEILGEDYVQVFINNIAISDRTKYDIINNSIVFLEGYAPEIGTDNVVILVASSPTEIGDLNTPPSNIQSVLDNMTNINAVASNKENIDIVATNISSVNTISTNIQAVIVSYDNASTASTQAGIATTKAGEAAISANNALVSEQNADISEAAASISASNALASENLSYKWSSNPKDEEVITGKYSAYHWSEKAKEFASGSAINIAYNNTISGLTAINAQGAIDELASGKAEDILVVHKDSTETITGSKTFTGSVYLESTNNINRAALSYSGLSDITYDFNEHMSIPAAYHIYNGQLSLSNTVTTAGFSTTLYTGNGATQSITTGIDMNTQWGNDVSEKFGGLVWIKGRTQTVNNFLWDTIRGNTKEVLANSTGAESTITRLSGFLSNGFSVANDINVNNNTSTYASWNFQTTHRVSGTTNHGKAFTCHYNPFTGFTIIKYEGSGLVGHEIPHHLGRKIAFHQIKDLSAATDWQGGMREGYNLSLNSTVAEGALANYTTGLTDTNIVLGNGANVNTATHQYVLYGWANSYFDEKNTLIGNYEIGIYQGTGVAGNKVTTRGKPAWVMIKRLDAVNDWQIHDNQRNSNYILQPNTSNAENTGAGNEVSYLADWFNVNGTGTGINASGGQYLYMVVYDNDSGSGKSKYPRATDTSTLNLNAHVPFANGIDTTGNKVSIAYKNETITLSNSLTQGKNYIALLNNGSYVATATKPSYGLINPSSGDFFNLDTQKWYSNSNVEITPRNYLGCIVYADQNGQPEYVEQIEKVQYFDAVKANDFRSKNSCTAWVNFDGTTTPPTIRDSYNVSAVIRTETGVYDIYFKEATDNTNYCIAGNAGHTSYNATLVAYNLGGAKTTSKCSIGFLYNASTHFNPQTGEILFFGGKN